MLDTKGGKPGGTSQFDTERWGLGTDPIPLTPDDGAWKPSVGYSLLAFMLLVYGIVKEATPAISTPCF